MAQPFVKVDVRVLEGYTRGLDRLLRNVVSVTAFNVEGKAKDKVPVDTGATKNSIAPNFPIEDRGLTARIGPSTDYAIFLELGTHKMAARPFMVPALEAVRIPFGQAVEKALELRGG